MSKNKCAICGEYFDDSETYEYRGVMACEEHFDELVEKRDYQRQQIIETTDKKIRSQADGEWQNGGYKTMKTDTSGRPITKVREPQDIKDYENGKTMNNSSQTKDMNELNNTIRHTLGWCLYSPPEKECQHLPANEDDEQTISELSTLITEQVRLGRIDELEKMVKEWGYGEYPSNDPRHGLDWEGWADYRTAQLDALLNTKETE